MRKTFSLIELMAVIAFAAVIHSAPAAQLGWNCSKDFLNPQTWTTDFGKLAAETPAGFRIQLDKVDKRMWFKCAGLDTAVNTHLELFYSSGPMYSSIFVYGPDEDGFEAARKKTIEFIPSLRYYPEHMVVDLSTIQRYKQGGLERLCLAFANSGDGATCTLAALAFRRGADTLKNGAMLLRDAEGLPLFWNFDQFVSLQDDCIHGLTGVSLGASGTARTGLDSLKPANRYRVSFYGRGMDSAQVRFLDDKSEEISAVALESAGTSADGYALYSLEYVVPEDAYTGVLELRAGAEGGCFGDALLEYLGAASEYHGSWIWTPEGTKNDQECYFRKEFEIADPAVYAEAFLQATCDDAFTMEVNGQRLFNYNVWSNPQTAEVKALLKPGKNVITANGHNGASAAGLLAELRLTDQEGNHTYVGTDETWICRTAAPPQGWRRMTLESTEGWVNSVVVAPYGGLPWLRNVKYITKASEGVQSSQIDKAAFAQRKTVARINRDLDYPRIEINGEIADPLIFGLRWKGDRTENFVTAKESGFNIFRFLWEFSFESWNADDTIDYTRLDKEIEELLTAIPDAKIILVMRISPPGWWQQKYPDELVKFADGLTTGADGIFASPASEIYRAELSEKIREFVTRIENCWYGSAIISYQPCNLRGPEWVLAQKHRCYADYSRPMRDYFRKYLREKYENDVEKLRAAWDDDSVEFDTAEIPEQARRMLAEDYFLPAASQDVMDYNRALQRANVDTIATFMDAFHDAAPDKLRSLYFGYLMTLTHISSSPAASGHYDLMRLIQMNKVDIFASPASYVWRKPGDITGVGSVEDSFKKNGVVWLHEADNRTVLTALDIHANTYNFADSMIENHRELIYSLIQRNPVWYYDLGGGWYSHKYFSQDFAKMREIYRKAIQEPVTYTPPMAMFFDEKAFDGVSLGDGNWGDARPFRMAAENQKSLARCGVPYDIFELEDIYSLDLTPYQVLVFTNAWRKNPRLAQFLQEKVYAAGKTAVFMYAAGYGQGGGVEGIRALTDMSVELMPLGTPLCYRNAAGEQIGYPGMQNTEVFAITEPSVEVIGKYEGTNSVAAARKAVANGSSVLLGVHDIHGGDLREVCVKAGVQPLVDCADRVMFDGQYLGLFAIDAPGKRTITLPAGTNAAAVTELFSGETLPVSEGSFTIELSTGDVRLYECK